MPELIKFLTPLVAALGRSERRRAATQYVEGLLIPGQRKSIEPMATRLGVDSQSLQQLLTSSPWSDEALWKAIRQEVIPHLEPLEAWVVDETGWLKQGQHSVGVSHQYCGSVGKSANCQVSVELVVSEGWIAAPVAAQLYLPKSWSEDAGRRAEAGVPPEIVFRTKSELALELIRQAHADGVSAAPVLGDSAYGDSGEFREGIRKLGMEFFLQVEPTHKAWTEPVALEKKRTRYALASHVPPARTLAEIVAGLPAQQWKPCGWKAASGRMRRTRLTWCEVYLEHSLRQQGKEPEQAWLVVDWPAGASAAYHYYLAHLHRPPSKARCLKLSRSRWHVEQYFQRAKDDLGLDHFEGRSWRGFHHHLVLSAVAYLFILVQYVRTKKNIWCDVGADPASDPAVAGEGERLLQLLRNQI
ncbi:MAG: IS701 family transposase [Bryobacterales bacterium]|nr:IS701 family transposase [Bryobacterales bacterium]